MSLRGVSAARYYATGVLSRPSLVIASRLPRSGGLVRFREKPEPHPIGEPRREKSKGPRQLPNIHPRRAADDGVAVLAGNDVTKRANKSNAKNAVPTALIVAVTLAVTAALLVWAMVALQRGGLMGPVRVGATAPSAVSWTAATHEQFRAECVATLVGNLPPLPNPETTDVDTRADYERLKLWLTGACDCVHYRVADRVTVDDAKLVLFGNNLNRAHPQYNIVMDNWNTCLDSNKEIMAPASPDMYDFRGGVAAQ